jgi:hypothetical protein
MQCERPQQIGDAGKTTGHPIAHDPLHISEIERCRRFLRWLQNAILPMICDLVILISHHWGVGGEKKKVRSSWISLCQGWATFRLVLSLFQLHLQAYQEPLTT